MFWIEKRRLWILVTVLVSIVLALTISGLNPIGRSVEPLAPLDEFTAHLDERIPALMRLYHIPGSSIAIVKDGMLVWSGAYGYADLASGRKLTTDTPMRVQSISKSVTAWAVIKLAEQGKIDLDSPVAKYLKSWPFPPSEFSTEEITVRQLLSHTAGLPLGDIFTIYSPEEAMPSLQEKLTEEAVPMRRPGTAFSYSNTGYNLLELLIQEATGQDFAEYLDEEVLAPLDMRHSSFTWSKDINPAVPVGYDLGGRPITVYVYPEKASGGLFSTAEDIAAFTIAGMANASLGKQVISPTAIEELYTPVTNGIGVYGLVFDSYGLGHYLETLPNGQQAVSHGGQGTGIMTHFHAVPEAGDAIVILTNSQRSWPFISYLLRDWATWCGYPSVGMGRIIWGKYGLWALICVLWTLTLLQVHSLAVGIMNRRPTASMQAKGLRLRCFTQAGLAIAIIVCLGWCLCQKYLFISSVFPRTSLWLGISAFAWSIILLLSAWFFARRTYIVENDSQLN